MTNSSWDNLICRLRAFGRRPAKRTRCDARQWELASERLEDRALLSAVSLAEPVAAEVSTAKKFGYAYPDVDGAWNTAIDNVPNSTTVQITRKGTKVTTRFTLAEVGEIVSKDKFTPETQLEYSGVVKVNNRELGKVTINLKIEFPERLNPPNPLRPTIMLGSVTISGGTLTTPIEHELAGLKAANSAAAAESGKGLPKHRHSRGSVERAT